jgi:hypothetical protein
VKLLKSREASFFAQRGVVAWMFGMVGICLIFAGQPFYQSLIGPLSNVFPATFAAIACYSAQACVRRYGLKGRSKFQLVWLSFTIGMALWIAAESTWAVYYFFLGNAVPYPSVADIFYVGGYLPIFAGLVLYFETFSASMSRARLAVAGSTIGVASVLVVYFVLRNEFGMNYSYVKILLDLMYPVLDLIMLSLAILSLAIFIGGRIAKYWVIFSSAAILYVIGDEFFLYQVANNTYYNGDLDDLIFLLGYLTFALAFYVHKKEF